MTPFSHEPSRYGRERQMVTLKNLGREGITVKLKLISVFALLAVSSSSQAGDFNRNLGFYHWGGKFTTSIHQGANNIEDIHGRVARISLSARYYVDYNVGTSCYQNYSLSAIVQEPDVKSALDNKSIEVFMLTAYDGITFGDCVTQKFLDPAFYTSPATISVKQEYIDFVLYLYRTYNGTGKRFIVSNWESDNAIYCGQAFNYAVSTDFRNWCNANYSTIYNGITGPEESMKGLKLWFETRQAGIVEGGKQAAALGLGGIDVNFAPEFNIVHALRDRGFESVLYDVIPKIEFDFVSYSSYESLDSADPAATLSSDLDLIREIVKSKNIIVGEAGFSRFTWGSQAVARTQRVTEAAFSWGVPYVIVWELYDQSETDSFGLYDLNGNMTPLGKHYRDYSTKSVE